MRQRSTRGRRTFASLLATGLVAGTVTLSGVGPAAADPVDEPAVPKNSPAETLGSHDAELLAEAEAEGARAVTLMIATDKGEAGDVAADLKKLGASVIRRFDKIGYVLARVPTGKVLTAARLPGVAALDLDETVKLPDPRPEGKAGARSVPQAAPAGPGAGTPAANPYMPTHEIGAVAFKQQHPTWDGRGVTIGIVDTGVDLDHPALQTTTTGQRKIVDWVTSTDPITNGDLTWRLMRTQVTGPTFTFAGATWTAPAGTWLVNRFSEAIATGEVGGDVNRDGDKTDTFGILYDPVSHDIRVDTDQDLDFTDNPVMRPYREKYDVGHFGTDNPATGVREQMPFVVEYREDVDLAPLGQSGTADFVNIGIVNGAHGSHVAGIAAANDLLGNARLDGAAPGARLVSARVCLWGGGCSESAYLTAMADLVVNRHVDVINMSIGGLPALNDGNDATARLLNRLIHDYGVQIFFSAMNDGPGVNTVGNPATTTDAVALASGISRETWLANYGAVTRTPYQLHNFSSRGPREDGGLKPDLTAPGSAISTVPMWQPGGPIAEAGYALPAGYAMFNGTSMASPQAAGAGALLLSAARATDRGVTPAALRRALYSSAKWISGVPAHGQGNGLVNVPGAWALLAKSTYTRTYTSDAPVCTPLAGFLATPNRGTGIHNRCGAAQGGHKPGQARTYIIKITRTSGPAGSVRHNLVWRGNDGSFTSPGSVMLPRGRAVNVTVTAKPGAGAHSAILRVDDPKTTFVDFELLNTVVAATDPVKPAYSFAANGSVDRALYRSFFVNVPKGAGALQVNLGGIATGSRIGFTAINPQGLPVDGACYMNVPDPGCKPQERDYRNPMPGVWEIAVLVARTSPSIDNPFQLTARVQGVTVDPAVLTLPSVKAGEATPVTWKVRNAFGPVTVTGRGGPLGSAVTARPTIAQGQQQTYEVVVPEGASRLDVAIGNPADSRADLDLFVYLGDQEVGRAADGDAEEAVSITNPAAGTYRIVVDGYAVPAGSTAYDYRDVFSSPSLGTVSVSPASVSLANGATATITGSVTANVAPAAGRELVGEMTVVTDEGAVVGRGTVRIGAVG